MSFKKLSLVILSILVLGFAASANADTLTLTNVNGQTDPTGQVYISPYYGNLNGSAVNLYCVDPKHDSYLNTSWSVNVTHLTSGDLSKTYLGTAGLNTYKEIAYLLFYYQGSAQAIQAAVWYLADPTSQYANSALLSTIGESSWQGLDYSNIEILSDPNVLKTGAGNQEFMIRVPEPSTLLLLGAGLVGLGLLGRKRFRAKP